MDSSGSFPVLGFVDAALEEWGAVGLQMQKSGKKKGRCSYLLRTCHGPGTTPGNGDTVANKTRIRAPHVCNRMFSLAKKCT